MDGGNASSLRDEAREAFVDQGTVPAASVVDRGGQPSPESSVSDISGKGKDGGLGLVCYLDLVAVSASVQPDRAAVDVAVEHF